MSYYTKTIVILMILGLVQGCASGGGINTAAKKNNFKWDSTNSTALNLMNSIEVDYIDNDRELPTDLKKELESSGSSELLLAAADGLSYSSSVHTLGHLSDLSALGLGFISFLTSTPDVQKYNNYYAFYLPLSEGSTIKDHLPFILGQLKQSLNQYGNADRGEHIEPLELKGNTVETVYHFINKRSKKMDNVKVTIELQNLGFVTENGIPPSLRQKNDKFLLVSARIARGISGNNAMAKNLAPNTFFFLYFGDRSLTPKKRRFSDPRVINDNVEYRFIKPI